MQREALFTFLDTKKIKKIPAENGYKQTPIAVKSCPGHFKCFRRFWHFHGIFGDCKIFASRGQIVLVTTERQEDKIGIFMSGLILSRRKK